ncbi:hypothetical protein D3C76_1207310 [compost metagenome]
MERGVGQGAEADAQVEAMAGQVQRMVTDLQLHFDIRIARVEVGERRADVAPAETQRGIDPDQPLGFGAMTAKQFLDLIDLHQNPRRVGKVQLAFSGQAH